MRVFLIPVPTRHMTLLAAASSVGQLGITQLDSWPAPRLGDELPNNYCHDEA